ncbi:YesU family protein [Puniceicoccaceae bacterium K14]|nr:YesU family protein [Puniceicoccaceae bacterium K14]
MKYSRSTLPPILTFLFCLISTDILSKEEAAPEQSKRFQELAQQSWKTVFYDSCTEDWTTNWTLDGTKAKITHSDKGMDYHAGPERKENTSHSVLWTKQSFEGDIRIDYEYTKIDDAIEAVVILYIQATGSELGPYHKNISEWAHLREIPSMGKYFLHMHLYHISYSAYDIDNTNPENDYVRARRYLPESGNALANTGFEPSYYNTGFFKKGVPHAITVIKKDNDLFMRVRNDSNEKIFHWNTESNPAITEGRIGLRHMWTRGARYKNFKIASLAKQSSCETHH